LSFSSSSKTLLLQSADTFACSSHKPPLLFFSLYPLSLYTCFSLCMYAWFLVFFDGTIALYDTEVSVAAAQWLDLLASLLVDGTQFTTWPWMDGPGCVAWRWKAVVAVEK
jgi:hypothetical protein